MRNIAITVALLLIFSLVACGGGGSSSASDPTGGKTVEGLWNLLTLNGADISVDDRAATIAELGVGVFTVKAQQLSSGLWCAYGGTYDVTGSTVAMTIEWDGNNEFYQCSANVGATYTGEYTLTGGGDTLTINWDIGVTEKYERI